MTEMSFREQPLDRFLELVASDEPAPGGGSVAAVATALAAGLVAMAGRFSSGHLQDAPALVEEADGLRQEALALADQDAWAYSAVRDAYALPKDTDPDSRRRRIRAALERATDVPLEVARVATRAAILGAHLAHGGNPNLKGDAVTAILLAKAAARGAVTLVEVNVRLGKLDGDWLDRSAAYLAAAGDACGVAAGNGAR